MLALQDPSVVASVVPEELADIDVQTLEEPLETVVIRRHRPESLSEIEPVDLANTAWQGTSVRGEQALKHSEVKARAVVGNQVCRARAVGEERVDYSLGLTALGLVLGPRRRRLEERIGDCR